MVLTTKISAQVFGNTDVPDYGSYGANQMVWLKIVTGPDDSGYFTHYGIYDHPTLGNTCEIKFSIYSQHPTFVNRPSIKLVEDFLANPINGSWNEVPVDPQVEIEPNTTYWIGLRFNCSYGSGRLAGTTWAEQPLRYYDSYSFFSPWPDPVSSSPSTFGAVNNVGLYLIGNNMTLPVDLLSFDIDKEKEQVKLNWKVASEINNDGWNIQRSTNGFTWSTIGHVSGRGDSNSEEDYTYIDRESNLGLVFYRLEQVDLDGQKAYSEVKSIDMYKSKFTVYPTLIEQYLTVDGVDEEAKYQIYSNSQVVKEGTISRGEQIDISNLASGMYYITINGEPIKLMKM